MCRKVALTVLGTTIVKEAIYLDKANPDIQIFRPQLTRPEVVSTLLGVY
jgi:hypothetical protein